jgi:hypothetical protein
MSYFKCHIGKDGGSDRIIFATRGFHFYLSVKAFGYRVRLCSNGWYAWVGKA